LFYEPFFILYTRTTLKDFFYIMDMSTLVRPLVMLSIPFTLWVLPMKVGYRVLVILAFFIWFAGGMMMSLRGVDFLTASGLPQNQLMVPLVAATIIGYLKGKFVLSKASGKNLVRLAAFKEPQKLIAVYPLRSWILIGVMIGLSLLITTFLAAQPLWRGAVNVGLGMALVASSLVYLKAITTQPTPTTTTDDVNQAL
jgi:hypothetical protein